MKLLNYAVPSGPDVERGLKIEDSKELKYGRRCDIRDDVNQSSTGQSAMTVK